MFAARPGSVNAGSSDQSTIGDFLNTVGPRTEGTVNGRRGIAAHAAGSERSGSDE
jgi:hypothetical protein